VCEVDPKESLARVVHQHLAFREQVALAVLLLLDTAVSIIGEVVGQAADLDALAPNFAKLLGRAHCKQ
jgi:hypothetical protein